MKNLFPSFCGENLINLGCAGFKGPVPIELPFIKTRF